MSRAATIIATSLVASALSLGAASVPAIAGSGGRIQFTQPGRPLDTRLGPLVTDVALPSYSILRLFVGAGAGEKQGGKATLHTCGLPVGAAPPLVMFSNDRAATAKVTTTANTCLSSNVPMYVVADQLGTIAPAAADGLLQYDAIAPQVLANRTLDGPLTLDRGNIPVEAAGVVLKIDVSAPTRAGAITGYDCAGQRPPFDDVAYEFAATSGLAYITFAGASSAPCVFSTTAVQTKVTLLGYFSTDGATPEALPPTLAYEFAQIAPPGLRPITPVRVLDTRSGLGRPGLAPVPGDGVVTLTFGKLVDVSSAAVVINLTVVSPAGPGYATVYPCDSPRPKASNLNFVAGQTVPNLVNAQLSAERTVCIYTSQEAHFVVDLSGTFEINGGAHAHPVAPERLLDSRTGLGLSGAGPMPANTPIALKVSGHATVPDQGAQAVTLNVTVTNPVGDSYLTVWPCDQTQPLVSNLNFVAKQTVPNLVTVAVSAAGTVCFASPVQTDVIADISMWFATSESIGFKPLAPYRLLDTRNATGISSTAPIAPNAQVPIITGGRGGVPPLDVVAVALNLTVTEPSGDGYATAWPCSPIIGPPPLVSNLNFVKDQTVANAATVQLWDHDDFCVTAIATAHFVIDVNGYYTTAPDSSLVPTISLWNP